MGVEVRVSPDKPLYSIDRDLAYLFPSFCKSVVSTLEDISKFPEVARVAALLQADSDSVMLVREALARFVERTCDTSYYPPGISVTEALDECGFSECDLSARTLVLYLFGAALLGTAFMTYRDSLMDEYKKSAIADSVTTLTSKTERSWTWRDWAVKKLGRIFPYRRKI